MGAHGYGGSLALRLEPAPVDELTFITAALEGDEQARAWLIRQHSTPVFRFCLRMLGNQEDAQDAAQEDRANLTSPPSRTRPLRQTPTITTVTLSLPPPWWAAFTSSRTATRGSE